MIYCLGCSWTAGAELVDSELFAGWPGAVDLGSEYSRRWSRDWFVNTRMTELEKIINDRGPGFVFELERRERERAWPAELARLTGRTVQNRAVNGAGQEQLLIQAREDLRDQESVTVILQMTSPYRWLFPNLYTREQPWASVLMGNRYVPGSPEDLAQRAFMAWPKESAEIKWLNDVINLIEFCRLRRFGISLIQAWDWEFDPQEQSALWSQIEPYLISDRSIDQMFGGNQRNPGGHPTQQTHDQLAQWLAAQL